MTDQDRPTDEPDELDAIDAIDEASIARAFAADVGDDIAALLADPDLWASPSSDLAESIVAAIGDEAVGARTAPTTDADAAPLAPSAAGGRRVAATADRLWSWRPAVLGAAAALILLLGGVLVFSALGGADDDELFAGELVPTGAIPDVGGEITVRSTESGLRVELDATGLPRRENGQFYEGWLRLDDDNLVPIGTFHEGMGVVLWAGIEPDRVVAMTITMEQAAEPQSADQGSSGEVVLKIDFPQR